MSLVNNSNCAGMSFVPKNKCPWNGHKKKKNAKAFSYPDEKGRIRKQFLSFSKA